MVKLIPGRITGMLIGAAGNTFVWTIGTGNDTCDECGETIPQLEDCLQHTNAEVGMTTHVYCKICAAKHGRHPPR